MNRFRALSARVLRGPFEEGNRIHVSGLTVVRQARSARPYPGAEVFSVASSEGAPSESDDFIRPSGGPTYLFLHWS